MPSYGNEAQRKCSYYISHHGAQITILRGSVSTTAPAMVQPLSLAAVISLQAQGLLNMNDAAPTNFICTAATDIKDMDKVTWNGVTYRINRVVPTTLDNILIKQNALGTQE